MNEAAPPVDPEDLQDCDWENTQRKDGGKRLLKHCPRCGLARVDIRRHMDTMPCRARQNRFAMEKIQMLQVWFDPAPARNAGIRVEYLESSYLAGNKFWKARIFSRYWVPCWFIPVWKDQQDRYLRYERREAELRDLVEDPARVLPLLTHISLGKSEASVWALEAVEKRSLWLPFLREHFTR